MICSAGLLPAQSPTAASSSSSQKGQNNEGNFVRRFSVGVTLSVLGLNQISGGTNTTTTKPNSATNVTADATSTDASSRIGYGVTAQVAITDHFAVAIGGYLRRMGYDLSTTLTTDTTTFINGVSSTTTTTTSTDENTRTRLLDIPIALRFYGKGRHTPGARWFVEGGGAWRDVRKVSTSLSSTDNAGTVTCCNNTAAQPAHRNARGFLGGAGAQFIDPFGIRVIPEVRYTRWVSPIFDTPATHMQRNQVEATLTLSF